MIYLGRNRHFCNLGCLLTQWRGDLLLRNLRMQGQGILPTPLIPLRKGGENYGLPRICDKRRFSQ